MHAVVRTYTGVGAKELFDILEKSKSEVEKTLSGVRGFVSYTLARTNDGGGFSVTVCKDKAGVDESVRVARDWIIKNASSANVGAPMVTDGSVIIHAT